MSFRPNSSWNGLRNRLSSLAPHRRSRRRQTDIAAASASELLEDRQLLAATMSVSHGTLTIRADWDGSDVTVTDFNPANSPYVVNDLLQVVDVSDGTTRVYMFHKAGINEIEFVGSNRDDEFTMNTGARWSPTIPMGGGQVMRPNYGMISGDIKGYGGADYLRGGAGDDYMDGGSGGDHMWGNSGDDWMYGKAGRDYMYGGRDNDHLFGGDDVDHMNGDAGLDGLYGGGSRDILWGSPDPDRFLLDADQYDYIPGGGLAEDVRIIFANHDISHIATVGGRRTLFGAGDGWSEAEIADMDDAFGVLAEATGTNILLRKPDATAPKLWRMGIASNNIVAYNSGGDLHFGDGSFGNEDWIRQTVYHEFGHNWDDYGETSVLANGWGPYLTWAFRQESGWTQSASAPSGGYTASDAPGDNWWYQNGSDFARSYGAYDPFEDWATTFAAYFAEEAGATFLVNDGDPAFDPAVLADKLHWVDLLVDLAADLDPSFIPGGTGHEVIAPSTAPGGAILQSSTGGPLVILSSSTTYSHSSSLLPQTGDDGDWLNEDEDEKERVDAAVVA